MINKIEEYPVQKEWVREAKKRALQMGQLKNSITSGEGNVAGCLGEIVVNYYLGRDPFCSVSVSDNVKGYDILLNDYKIDVKTKRCAGKPKDYYECSVKSEQILLPECTHYIFTRVKNDYSLCWICGWIEKPLFIKHSNFLKKGDPDGDNGYIVKHDCFNLPIKSLEPMKIFLDKVL